MFKALVVAAGLSLGLLASGGASPALAGSNIDIGIGLGGGYGEPGLHYIANRVSCRDGARIVRSAGFRNVRAVDCQGRNMTYYGTQRQRMFQIEVRSRDGSIRSVKRLRGGGGGYDDGGYDDSGYGDDYDDDY